MTFASFPEPVLARFMTEFADSETFPPDSEYFRADSVNFPGGFPKGLVGCAEPWPAMAHHGPPLPAMALHGPPWLAIACHGLPWLAMVCHGLPWPAWPAMADQGQPWRGHGAAMAGMASHGRPRQAKAGPSNPPIRRVSTQKFKL